MNAPDTVLVDIVSPGSALIVIAGHDLGAQVGRTEIDRQFYVEDDAIGQIVAVVSGYRAAGTAFARHHGITPPAVVVENEVTGTVRTYVS